MVMVRTVVSQEYTVTITATRENGEISEIASPPAMIASDAFDYAANAVGYFRFYIADTGMQKIEIEVMRNRESVELIEITRD